MGTVQNMVGSLTKELSKNNEVPSEIGTQMTNMTNSLSDIGMSSEEEM